MCHCATHSSKLPPLWGICDSAVWTGSTQIQCQHQFEVCEIHAIKSLKCIHLDKLNETLISAACGISDLLGSKRQIHTQKKCGWLIYKSTPPSCLIGQLCFIYLQ